MRRMGNAHLRAIGAVSGVVACAGAGVAVAANPKPGGAPLNPPVAVARATPAATATPAPVCGASSDPAVASAFNAARAALTAARRQAALRGLTPDQRQQVTALLRACAGGSGAGTGGSQPMPTIQPSIVDAGPTAAPITNSYVS